MVLKEHNITKNQNTRISNDKPLVQFQPYTLKGYTANSMNGGMIKPIFYMNVLTGQPISTINFKANFKLTTPISPSFQRLVANCRVYFVPHSRVMTNYDKFRANKSDNTISELPNARQSNVNIENIISDQDETNALQFFITNTDLWRDSYISSYYPRFKEESLSNRLSSNRTILFPKISVLPLRAFKAIYNDFERSKIYDTPLTEYLDDTCTSEEMNSYLPYASPSGTALETQLTKTILRAKRNNEYYTDYRTDLFGYVPGSFPSDMPIETLYDLNYQQQALADARQSAENIEKNDWDIITQMFGSRKLVEKRVNYLGEFNVPINYEAITQSTYNTNTDIEEQYQVLGEQGAVAYTECDINIPIFNTFAEDGTLHILCTLTADTIFETAVDRTLLNVTNDSLYRPDLVNQLDDVLFDIESDTIVNDLNSITPLIKGYKRKYSEYLKLPNQINGDLTTLPILETQRDTSLVRGIRVRSELPTKQSYQFFELSDKVSFETNVNPSATGVGTEERILKNVWKDYTDLLINRKQAIKNFIEYKENTILIDTNINYIRVLGENQLYFMGLVSVNTELPMPVERIKNNETNFGEN